MQKGLTLGQFGVAAGAGGLPVGRQSPGAVPLTYGVLSSAPSPNRSTIIAAAVALPTASPPATSAVAGRPVMTSDNRVASGTVVVGKEAASVSWAACASAASIEAVGDAGTDTT